MIDYSNRISPERITGLRPNEVFVFGSNLAGRHGAGAAKQALKWGAKYGCCFGQSGYTYAIPTKDRRLEVMTPKEIAPYIVRFLDWAKNNYLATFLVTEIGCGLAGMTPEQIAPLFKDAIDLPNVHLPKRFWEVLQTTEK